MLLIGIVTARQWQLDPQVEEVLRHIIKAKRNSVDAAKRYSCGYPRFSNFMTHFWSKKAIHQDFNDHELEKEIRDELGEYSNPYSYYS